nr:neuronal-specific septin-3 [Quercus suber]
MSINRADMIPDGVDYSVAHRAPPPIPAIAYSSTAPSRPPIHTDLPGRPNDKDEAAGSISTGRRRGSFSSFLRKKSMSGHPGAKDIPTGSSHSNHNSSSSYTAPAVPAITQAHRDHANATLTASNDGDLRLGRTSKDGGGRNMLRKASKVRAEREQEQERIAKEQAAARLRPAPSLPQHSPLPIIGTFGGDDARSDVPAMSNGNYTYHPVPLSSSPPHHSHHQLRSQPQSVVGNFSRPSTISAMSPSGYNSSSSPAYALRSNHNHQQSSSPVVGAYTTSGEYVPAQQYDRSESITNRGRYSYASSNTPVNVNSPRRIRRRKDPTPFNVLVIGAKNSGKTSFISFLRHSLALSASAHRPSLGDNEDIPIRSGSTSFTSQYLEADMESERVGVTLWDSAGLEKNIVDLQLREMAAFVESKFEETFLEEQKVVRSPGVKDTHIHCVFLVLDPVRLGMSLSPAVAYQNGGAGLTSSLDDDLDLQVLRTLWGKTTVIPIISKADTATVSHMRLLKRAVWKSLKAAKLDPLEALELDEDAEEDDVEDDDEAIIPEHDEATENGIADNVDEREMIMPKTKRNTHKRQSSLAGAIGSTTDEDTPYIPMSIISPDPWDLPPYASKSRGVVQGNEKIGRRFPWGFADPYDAQHCDFIRLRDSIFREWRADLRDLARTKWYENWRTSRLKNLPGSRQRVRGGVTPVSSVPTEGRTTSPKAARNFSTPHITTSDGAAAAVPRTVPTVGISLPANAAAAGIITDGIGSVRARAGTLEKA